MRHVCVTLNANLGKQLYHVRDVRIISWVTIPCFFRKKTWNLLEEKWLHDVLWNGC